MEAKNIIFNSCLVMEGQAIGIVFRTGDLTLIGTIARMTARPKEGISTLRREILYLVKILTVLSMVMGTIMFFVGVSNGAPLILAFIDGFIMVIIANVP